MVLLAVSLAKLRAGVMTGAAHTLGRAMLEAEAEGELARPADVHLHLTDPARYVNAEGQVDRDAIRRDVGRLVDQRPELSPYGTGPGQHGARPDNRRRAQPGGHIGAAGGPPTAVQLDQHVKSSRDQMQRLTGVTFALPAPAAGDHLRRSRLRSSGGGR